MYTLVIETSTEQGVVAILKGRELVQASYLPFGYNQSNNLLPHIQMLFQSVGMALQQIDLIAVGVGPGSYTGIRIGAAAAKTLAYACQKPLIGVCTLEAFLPQTTGPFAAILDAKISGCYVLKGLWDGKTASYDAAPQVVPLEQLPDLVTPGTRLITPYARILRTKIDKLHANVYPHWSELPPCPQHLGRRALYKHPHQEAISLELLYLRETEAERNKNRSLK